MAITCEWTRVGDPPCCCPSACCLYPWPDPDGIAGGPYYPTTDLPATIVVTIDGTPFTLTLNSGTYTYGDPSFETSETPFVTAESLLGENNWYLAYAPVSGDEVSYYGSSCLINPLWEFRAGGPFTISSEDEFLDTYTITFTPSGGGTPFDVEVTRETEPIPDICTWVGFVDLALVYLYYDSAAYKWKIQFPEGGACYVKDDPQSSPVGTYASDPECVFSDDFTVVVT